MWLACRRANAHADRAPIDQLCAIEVVTPRTNAATLTSAENLFASMAASSGFSVELAADDTRRRFLMRAQTEYVRKQLVAQLSAAYPQAELRSVPLSSDPTLPQPGEQIAACAMVLRKPEYLPLRQFTDADLDAERAAQSDPLLAVLSGLGNLPSGWRAVSQINLERATEDWSARYHRLSLQHPLEGDRADASAGSAGRGAIFLALLLALMCFGLRAYILSSAHQWVQLAAFVLFAGAALAAILVVISKMIRTRVYDMDLVRDKVSRIAFRASLRLIVFAPVTAQRALLKRELVRIAAAYGAFNLSMGNGLVMQSFSLLDAPSRGKSGPARGCRRVILTTRELACLWHLPHAAADVALLERTTARQWLPPPFAMRDGCHVGVSRQHAQDVPVALPKDVLRRHLLLVAKTRRGKSSLMQRLAEFSMRDEPRRCVLLVDPHRDLAAATLKLVPPGRTEDVVFLDVANSDWPFGLNLLDAQLGWQREQAVANTLAIFEREWGERFWGPRMEDAFRFALLTLFDANVALTRADPSHGRSGQFTLLEIPYLLSDAGFRREVLDHVEDAGIRAWWSRYFEPLDRRFQQELINPVLTKIHRFEGSGAARYIVGQAASTIDPVSWLRGGRIVIVNTARGSVGENAAALIGSTLLNLVSLAVADQARVDPDMRCPISIYVDEFHTIPGADYEAILAELGKYGANLVLATQSLARLVALGRDSGRGLRATVFANIDGLFAFNCSAEDAQYLVPELGGALDEQDLVELGEHQCYMRLSSAGRRLPTFSVHLDPPPVGDQSVAARIASDSAERHGRPVSLVQAERRSQLARVLESKGSGVAAGAVEPPKRNEHRRRKKRRDPDAAHAATEPHQSAS